ncbi:MAG: helicase-related protein [Gammaproteobacteria bacterium]|nr:helicase-related protein [Gammaproteobacteria bacterium]
MELLDPYRFTRGIKIRGRRDLEQVMVRRLKEDIRQVQGGFPKRNVKRLEVDNLPPDAPELVLSRLLDEYRTAREQRHATSSKRAQAAAGLLVVGLQQRLLSSIEAFARSLKVHRETVLRHWNKAKANAGPPQDDGGYQLDFYTKPAGSDDERGEMTDDDADAEDRAQTESLTTASESGGTVQERAAKVWAREQELLDEMQRIAEETKHLPDAKTRRLIDWIRENQCPELPPFGERPLGSSPQWSDRRVLIFTENRQGTKFYLRNILQQAVEFTDGADDRIQVIDGLTSGARRKEIQRRFNTHPAKDPLRILIATDAAREGLNFQAHCSDLFHFDLPWNPGRIEQRNGRVDRKLQPQDEVNCHYFVLPQRAEDRVLEVLVNKTETIKRELGSLSQVIDDDVERRLKGGIRHQDADTLRLQLEAADLDATRKEVTTAELEDTRDRQDALSRQIDQCRNLLDTSRRWVGFDAAPFQDAISCSLELLGADPLAQGHDESGNAIWEFPPLDQRAATDPTWTATLDTLRVPRKTDQKLAEWRRDAPIRPVTFEAAKTLTEDTVHLHLEQRVAQRLLARFRSQGFIHHDLSRACLAQTKDSTPRVVLLGRLALYGNRAERLHEEVITVAARWTEPHRRKRPLQAYARQAETLTLGVLDQALTSGGDSPNEVIQRRLLDSAPRDIEDLRPQLEPRAKEFARVAIERLGERGELEAVSLRQTLDEQRQRVVAELQDRQEDYDQLLFEYLQEEVRQLDADMRHWRMRLEQFDRGLKEEPDRIREFYKVRAQRVEPVGLVYLWPETN